MEQADGEFHTYAGRRVPKYVSSAEGNTRTLTISSRPLLIPNNKNPWIVADVLGGITPPVDTAAVGRGTVGAAIVGKE